MKQVQNALAADFKAEIKNQVESAMEKIPGENKTDTNELEPEWPHKTLVNYATENVALLTDTQILSLE